MRNFLRRWLGIEALHTELYERLPGVRNEVDALFSNAVRLDSRVAVLESSEGRDAECRRYAERIDYDVKGSQSDIARHTDAIAETLRRVGTLEASIAALRRDTDSDNCAHVGAIRSLEKYVAEATRPVDAFGPIHKKLNGVLTPKLSPKVTPKKKPAKKKPTRGHTRKVAKE